ncbi:MAG: hypothetical protein HY822_05765 [Acidobacteria bacterium]|nr:hypothetical protein [Acidobacteriota bacterium]
MMRDEAKVRFQDGMRVTRQHMEHLQDTLLADAIQLRQALGAGKVCHGFQTVAAGSDKVKVSPGLAFDALARPVILDTETEVPLDFSAAKKQVLALVYSVRAESPVNGVPSLLYHRTGVEARAAAPPYADGALPFAEVDGTGGTILVFQKPEWYLTAPDHRHSGQFRADEAARWRYDGVPLGLGDPRFDSGFVPVPAGGEVRLVHGLNTINLLVQMQCRLANGVITMQGFGNSFWYELAGHQEVALVRSATGEDEVSLRVALWPFGAGATGPAMPIAIAGADFLAEFGQSFALDGGRSRSFDGKPLKKYVWTQMS